MDGHHRDPAAYWREPGGRSGRASLYDLDASSGRRRVASIRNGRVVEEVERHLNLAVAYGHNRTSPWTGRVPFLYSAFVLSGRPESEFLDWQRNICGREQPLQDVSDYLADEFCIETKSLLEYSEAASLELRGAVQELWNETHERRRQRGDYGAEQGTRSRLVAHDVENSVGVIEYRRTIGPSPMGYLAWWLTFDGTAMKMKDHLRERLGPQAPASPVLSPDFLTQLLRFGPSALPSSRI